MPFDGDVDTPYPRPIHTNMSDQVATLIRNCDVHRLTDFDCLRFSCSNHSPCVFQVDHDLLLSCFFNN